MLVDHARPERLRDLVRALVPDYPALEVHTDVTDVYGVPEGSVMVLAPRAEDADWLNMQRPVFARRELKVILWCDSETSAALATTAIDFFDWISHRHECPPGVALHGVLGLRTADAAGVWIFSWTGGDLEGCFREAFPGQKLVRLSAKRPFPELVDAVRKVGPEWIVWSDVDQSFRAEVVEQVLVEANRRRRVILDAPVPAYVGFGYWPEFHGRHAPLREARSALAMTRAIRPGRLAALTGLEPEAVELLIELLRRGDDEQILEHALWDAEDPGLIIAQRLGPISITPASKRTLLPPLLRAAAAAEKNYANPLELWWHWDAFERDLDAMESDAIFTAMDASSYGELDEAEALAKRAVAITTQVSGAESGEHAEALGILAKVLVRRGQFREAETLLREALVIREGAGHQGATILGILSSLADVLTRQGRYPEAEEMAERALQATRHAGNTVAAKRAKQHLEEIRALRTR